MHERWPVRRTTHFGTLQVCHFFTTRMRSASPLLSCFVLSFLMRKRENKKQSVPIVPSSRVPRLLKLIFRQTSRQTNRHRQTESVRMAALLRSAPSWSKPSSSIAINQYFFVGHYRLASRDRDDDQFFRSFAQYTAASCVLSCLILLMLLLCCISYHFSIHSAINKAALN